MLASPASHAAGDSSVSPLQLSSIPLHVSVPGVPATNAVQVAAASLTQQPLPDPHFLTPFLLHVPTPTLHAGLQNLVPVPTPHRNPVAHCTSLVHVQRPALHVVLPHSAPDPPTGLTALRAATIADAIILTEMIGGHP